MPDPREPLWAPWRMAYIENLAGEPASEGCFLCRYAEQPERDADNLVLARSETAIVLLNRYPYNNGHLLIAPLAHRGQLEDLSDAVLTELTLRIRDAKRVLERVLSAQGFNVGMNLGRCAGAGLPDHLHWHIVPRWGGDTNYMSVVGDTRVIPQALSASFEMLRCGWRELLG